MGDGPSLPRRDAHIDKVVLQDLELGQRLPELLACLEILNRLSGHCHHGAGCFRTKRQHAAVDDFIDDGGCIIVAAARPRGGGHADIAQGSPSSRI